MKIAFFELSKADQSSFLASFIGAEVVFFEEKLNADVVSKIQDVEVVSVFVDSMIDKNIIDALPNLKFIATRSTGFNHIDIEHAKTKNIKVSNVPAYGSHTVAEFAFGLILDLSRNVSKANHHIRESADFNYFDNMEGFDLQGKTLGVIGTGKIGKNVVKIAKGFGMEVLAYDLYPDLNFAKENNFIYKSLLEVLAESDVLTLHAPYTKENHHLINQENIKVMKKGIYLINTARGELVDTSALVWGLKEGIIAGAGLDVLEGESILKEEFETLSSARLMRIEEYKTLVEDHMLMDMPNVIITPHIAFYTREAVAEIQKITISNIQGFVSNLPVNLVS